jgi:tellurite methyltransferase
MSDNRRRAWEDRHRSSDLIAPPSPFVVHALDVLTATTTPSPAWGRALDVACGRGRHALLLAAHGFDVEAVDFALPALTTLMRTAATRGVAARCLAADVTTWPIPTARYALVVVVDFLERALFPVLRSAVAPGGALLYETYRRSDEPDTTPPRRAEFLLEPGELDDRFRDWHVLLRHDARALHHGKPTARSGVLARRPLDAPH